MLKGCPQKAPIFYIKDSSKVGMAVIIDEMLAEGKKIPFATSGGTINQVGETKYYELGKDSELEVEYVDGSKETINAIEFMKRPKKEFPKANELVMGVRVTKE